MSTPPVPPPAPTPFQQTQLQTLLSQDPTHFATLLTHLTSPSNPTRTEAEALYTLLKTHHPTPLSLLLTHTLTSSPHTSHRSLSAILLRKLLPSLPPPSLPPLTSPLLTCLSREPHPPTLKKISDTVSELALSLLPTNLWPDLLPFLLSTLNPHSAPVPPGPAQELKECCLLVLSSLANFATEALRPHLATLQNIVMTCLSGSGVGVNVKVKVAAVSVAVSLVQGVEEREKERFQDMLEPMMGTLAEALNKGEEASAQEVLEVMVELAGSEPRFLRRRVGEVVGGMVQVAEAEGLEEGTRHLAVEFVVTLAESAPGVVRKLPGMVRRVFAVLMRLLEDVEDVEEWYKAVSEEDEDAGETSNYGVGLECLDRLAIALGGNAVVPVASEVLGKYLGSADWKKRHAALICLAQIAEGCSKVTAFFG